MAPASRNLIATSVADRPVLGALPVVAVEWSWRQGHLAASADEFVGVEHGMHE